MGFVGVGSSSNMNSRTVAGSRRGDDAGEGIGRLNGFANGGMGSINSGFNYPGGFGAAMGPSSFVGDLPDQVDSMQRIHPTLSHGTVGPRVPAVGGLLGGLMGESADEFADRFLSEDWHQQQPEDDEQAMSLDVKVCDGDGGCT